MTDPDRVRTDLTRRIPTGWVREGRPPPMRPSLFGWLGAAGVAALLGAGAAAAGAPVAGATVPATPDSARVPPLTPGCAARHYRVQAVPLIPRAVNERGEIAGMTARHRAALWSAGGGLTELELPAGFDNAEAVSINDAGHAVVVAHDSALQRHQSFLYAGGTLTPLPDSLTRATHINAADEIVGEAVGADRTGTHPARWRRGALDTLPDCCGGSLADSNARGVAIGDLYDRTGRYGAFAWTGPAAFGPIGPAEQFSTAVAINGPGHVLIQGFPGAYLWIDGAAQRLILAPHRPSHPRAMNDCDVIVGDYGPFSDAARAFVWTREQGFRDLNTLIGAPDWTLEKATAISNRGEIVGRGDHGGQDGVGFALRPD